MIFPELLIDAKALPELSEISASGFTSLLYHILKKKSISFW